MSRQEQPQQDNDLEYGWTDEAKEEYRLWCERYPEDDERDLEPHKRKGYLENEIGKAEYLEER